MTNLLFALVAFFALFFLLATVATVRTGKGKRTATAGNSNARSDSEMRAEQQQLDKIARWEDKRARKAADKNRKAERAMKRAQEYTF